MDLSARTAVPNIHGYEVLCPRCAPIFPALQRLTWRPHPHGRSFQFLRAFIASTLTSIHLIHDQDSNAEITAALALLPSNMPLLEEFDIQLRLTASPIGRGMRRPPMLSVNYCVA